MENRGQSTGLPKAVGVRCWYSGIITREVAFGLFVYSTTNVWARCPLLCCYPFLYFPFFFPVGGGGSVIPPPMYFWFSVFAMMPRGKMDGEKKVWEIEILSMLGSDESGLIN